jgi:S1-C subfamily serine protease
LRVGEWVVAVGHPFDFQFTVTAGIVSARGRRNLARDEIQDYIQTDAAVNPGSSGGPLFNLDGEVVGINTAIFNPGAVGTNAGISFAIPANMANRIIGQLRDTGRVARAGLGLSTADRRPSAENPRPGAEVLKVVPEGPAETAGLRRGDVITSVQGEPIAGSDDLRGIVLASDVGARLALEVERGAEHLTLTVATRDDRDMGPLGFDVPDGAVEWGGLVLATLDADSAARFGAAPPEREGPMLIVLAVAPASPGAAAGMLPGDVLLKVQNTPVGTVDELLAKAGGRRSATVSFWRNGGESIAILGGLERRQGR